jgi:MoaA/NifB/PqqE/SkfB family radical SAM enzyme
LKDLLNRSDKEMKIVIKTIIMGYNAKEILPLVKWAENNRFDEIKFQPLESNLEGRDDPHWFESSSYWPKGKEINEITEIMEELIAKKQAGSIIYNSALELKNIRDYFIDPIAYYDQTKNHTLGAGKQSEKCRTAVGQMEILSKGGLRMCRYMPPQGDIRAKNPRAFWRNRPTCWKNPANFCFKQTN